jgi:excisionase family DNA binding protein
MILLTLVNTRFQNSAPLSTKCMQLSLYLLEKEKSVMHDKFRTYITVRQAMDVLQVSRSMLYKLINDGFLTRYKVGSRTFFNKEEIYDFFENSAVRS